MDRLGRLNQLTQDLFAEFKHTPVIAGELEFYVPGASKLADLSQFWETLRARCIDAGLPLLNIEAERGHEQFEMAMRPRREAGMAAQDIVRFKQLLSHLAQEAGVKALFAAKPYADQPGSGLHIHIHLENEAGENMYWKQEAQMSDALRHSLGGLLATMRESMSAFAPAPESRSRFVAGGNAPTTLSWGANNRTTALRLPGKPSRHKHIEHRVAGADAEPAEVIAAILAGIHYGLRHGCEPGAQIYGDASLAMYGLPKLFG